MRRLVSVLLLLCCVATGAGADDEPMAVIVHPDRRDRLDRDDVARIFLARRRFWDDGAPIVPLNLPAGTALRERFSREVLHEQSRDLQRHWNEAYFHGVLPPPVLSSPLAVKRYVAADRNAIGYVPSSDVDDTIRVVLTLP
jgi:hypothetical protein